ncbi:MAG: discoidin domain-containing protein [Erysipelotrichaceae bacterium]
MMQFKKFMTSALVCSMVFSTFPNGILTFASESTKVNLALSGSATANDSETDAYGASKAIDGVTNRTAPKPQSRWATNQSQSGTDVKTLTIDLGAVKSFNEFKIEWERKNIQGFNIEVSDTVEGAYKKVYTKENDTNITSFTSAITLSEATSARFVRLNVTKYDGGSENWKSVSVYEFGIYTTIANDNLALGSQVIATSNGVEDNAPSLNADKFKDGNMNTRWASSIGVNEKWVTLNFGSQKELSSVVLEWERKNATSYKIQSSNDGTTWSDVKTFTKAPSNFKDVINFDQSITAQYLRVDILDFVATADKRDGTSVTWSTVSIYEFEAYQFKQTIEEVTGPTIDEVCNDLSVPTIGANDTKYTLPSVPAGYEIELIGADYEQILDHDLTIYKPIIDTDIVVNFVVKKMKNGKVIDKKDSKEYRLTIPGTTSSNTGNAKPIVIPELAEWVGTSGNFEINETSRIMINPAYKTQLNNMATQFKEDYKAICNHDIQIVEGTTPAAHDFYFTLGASDAGLKKEGYRRVVGESVKVEAVDQVGAIWSTKSILQILKQNKTYIPQGTTRDYPKYEIRGFMLDVGRKPFSLAFLKEMAKNMSYYKMNDFQLHLSDNYIFLREHGSTNAEQMKGYSGFRLESDIKKGGNGGLNKQDLTSKDMFYSKADFRSFIKDSRKLGVNIIPEFDTPAHALALVKTRPDLQFTVADELDVTKPETLEFVQSIWNEYLDGSDPVFDEDTVMNIGTDEFKGDKPAFIKYTDDMIKYGQAKGRKVRLWGSLTAANIGQDQTITSKDVQMNMWYNGYAQPADMYKRGYEMINMNDGQLYIVPDAGYYNDYLNARDKYNNWVPNNIGGVRIPVGSKQMLGSDFAVWNDMIDLKANGISELDIYDRVIAAIPALSSKDWGEGSDINFDKLSEVAATLEDAPNTNPRFKAKTDEKGKVLNYKFNQETIKDSTVNHNDSDQKVNVEMVEGKVLNAAKLNGGASYVETPIDNVGPQNNASFWIKKDKGATGEQILFESDGGCIKMSQKETGQVGFSREGYHYSFNYTLPEETWVKMEIRGYMNKSELYINGTLIDTLSKGATGGKNATMILPLDRIGSKTDAFKGTIDELVVKYGNQQSAKDETIIDNKDLTATSDNANAGSESEGPISFAFDNNPSTHWHTQYSPSKKELPATVNVDFNEAKSIDQFDYLPRSSGANGNITSYELYAKNSGKGKSIAGYTLIASGTWSDNNALKKIKFDACTTTGLKFVALTGHDGFASASEFVVHEVDNKISLRALVSTCDAYSEEDFTAATWKDYSDALKIAETILADKKATEKEIKDAQTNLENGIKNLGEKQYEHVDKVALRAYITSASSKDKTDYTNATWLEFEKAISDAQIIVNNINASQQKVDDAYAHCLEKGKALVFVMNKQQKADLNTLLKKLEALNLNEYSDAKDKVIEDAIRDIKAALQTSELTKDAAEKVLNKAQKDFDQLVKLANTNQLKQAIKEANSKVASEYTKASWNTFVAALQKAVNMLSVENENQNEVDACSAELSNAMKALEKVQVEKPVEPTTPVEPEKPSTKPSDDSKPAQPSQNKPIKEIVYQYVVKEESKPEQPKKEEVKHEDPKHNSITSENVNDEKTPLAKTMGINTSYVMMLGAAFLGLLALIAFVLRKGKKKI